MTRLRRLHDTEGMTLIEVLITMVLLGAVSTLVVGAVAQTSRVFLRTDEEGQGLADAKVVLDRVTRDIREASRVTCDDVMPGGGTDPGCTLHLELWLDDNADYVGPPATTGGTEWAQPEEMVTWYVVPSGDGVHCDVLRKQGSQTATKVADSLVIDGDSSCRTFFEYEPLGSFTQAGVEPDLVTFKMFYDPNRNTGVDERLASTSAHLRNG